jgi:hypothetical protein
MVVKRKQVARRSKSPLMGTIPIAPTETAKVSMADCLACSGCITSAETVLVEQHSLKTLRELLSGNRKKVCIPLSPASLADLLRHLQVPTHQHGIQTKQHLATFLLSGNRKKVCIPLSPASLADLLRHLQVPTHQNGIRTKQQVATFLAQIKPNFVVGGRPGPTELVACGGCSGICTGTSF